MRVFFLKKRQNTSEIKTDVSSRNAEMYLSCDPKPTLYFVDTSRARAQRILKYPSSSPKNSKEVELKPEDVRFDSVRLQP